MQLLRVSVGSEDQARGAYVNIDRLVQLTEDEDGSAVIHLDSGTRIVTNNPIETVIETLGDIPGFKFESVEEDEDEE